MIYIKSIRNTAEQCENRGYPYSIPSIRNLVEMEFRKRVTFVTGENGSGKSTLIEAIAIKAGFNPEGGSRNFNFSTHDTHSGLYNHLKLVRGAYRNKDGFFLRAESLYNVATKVDKLLSKEEVQRYYGGSLHQCSHGESFLALVRNRLSGNGLYIFDEPEAALSIQSQLKLLVAIKGLVQNKSQFIIATHSPILLAYPDADIYHILENGLDRICYEDTEQYKLTKYFLNNYEGMLVELGWH